MQTCLGKDCLRREECQRFVEREYFGNQQPFANTLCFSASATFHDYFVPMETIVIKKDLEMV